MNLYQILAKNWAIDSETFEMLKVYTQSVEIYADFLKTIITGD